MDIDQQITDLEKTNRKLKSSMRYKMKRRCPHCEYITELLTCPVCNCPLCTGRDPHVPATDRDSGHDVQKERGHLGKIQDDEEKYGISS